MDKLPSLKPDRVIRALQRCGLTVIRQRGSHTMLRKPGMTRPLVVARHNRELSPDVIAGLLTQADVAPEEFLGNL